MLSETKSLLSAAKAGFSGKNLSFLFVALFLLQLTTFAQTKWYKYAGNPVLEKGAPGEWDATHVRQPSVLWDGTKYNMWYSGMNGDVQAMGYAWSDDGIHWTKDIINNPVLERGAPGEWDSDFIAVTSVLFDGTLFKLWYAAGGGKTGLATSPDEIHWLKDTINNPVLTGTPGTWDEALAAGAQVIYENSIYQMWYMGARYNANLGLFVLRLGYAESDSGITWIKHPDPVMEEGDYITWANDLTTPFVIYKDNNYTMWYVSRNTFSNSHGEKINYATSSDGVEWIKDSLNNPVLLPGISPAWDYLSIWKPSVIKENNLYKMWYTGETSQVMSIGYAEDFSKLVHADSVIIKEPYVEPNTDPANILGRVINPEGHALTAKAMILSDDGSIQDSVELFDDGLHGDGTAGDGIYGGFLPVTDENFYTVGIKTVDQETGFTRNGLNWNITDRFTTIGAVVFEDYVITSNDTILNPGDQIRFKLELRNNGLTETAVDIMAVISTTDSCISEISKNSANYGDIPAGESVIPASGFQQYTVEINPNCLGNIDVLFNVDIYSDGILFWSDSFAFHIYNPTAIADEKNSLPDKYALPQNYPNPFNPTTTIKYQIPELSFVTIKVYDVLGSEITTLVNEEKPVGSYEVDWNASNVPSGIYFYQLKTKGYLETKKMVLLR